jgi:(p)ppGpp synthase/HD superfamily hydrolase
MNLMTTTTSEIEDHARLFAQQQHADQINKHDGEPYIRHVERVVEHLRKAGADDITLACAWLHDVVEDTAVTLDVIRDVFGTEIRDAVDALTHRKDEPRLDYYLRVGSNRRALTVKMSDGRDNQNPARKNALDADTRARLDLKYQIMNWALMPFIIHHLEHTEEH